MESYLDKIREIEKESQFIPDSYESFKRKAYLDKDLNQYTREHIRSEQHRKKKDEHSRAQKAY